MGVCGCVCGGSINRMCLVAPGVTRSLCNSRRILARRDNLQVEEELGGGGRPEVLASVPVRLHGPQKHNGRHKDDGG